jgi:hypothetical protein
MGPNRVRSCTTLVLSAPAREFGQEVRKDVEERAVIKIVDEGVPVSIDGFKEESEQDDD